MISFVYQIQLFLHVGRGGTRSSDAGVQFGSLLNLNVICNFVDFRHIYGFETVLLAQGVGLIWTIAARKLWKIAWLVF